MSSKSGSHLAAVTALVVTLAGMGAWSAIAATGEGDSRAVVTTSSPVKPAGAARPSTPEAILAACMRAYGIRPVAGIPMTACPPQLVEMCTD